MTVVEQLYLSVAALKYEGDNKVSSFSTELSLNQVGCLLSDELERNWKEATMAESALHRH